MKKREFTLQDLADRLGAKLHGDASCIVHGLAQIDKAVQGEITFLSDNKYASLLPATKASAVVVREEHLSDCPANALVMSDPYLGFARLAALYEYRTEYPAGIHPSAVVAESAHLADGVVVCAGAVIGDHARVGENSVIRENAVIGDHVAMGASCMIHPNATLYHHVRLGDRVIVQSNSVIGSDGFGLARDEQGAWLKIAQLGTVILEDDVEIGANTSVDRGALEDTVIARGAKLDNQIQIAHNVKIGEGTAIAACAGIAGSTTIGKHCVFGGGARINGHITIGDQVMLTASTSISKSISGPGVYSGTMPGMPVKDWNKNAVRMRQLNELFKRVKKLEDEQET